MAHRPLHTVLDDASTDSVACEAGGVVDVEFRHNMLTMLFDGLEVDAEFRRGFLVGVTLSDQLQHFHLARSQLVEFMNSTMIRPVQVETIKMLGNRRAEDHFPLKDFPNSLAYIMGGRLLDQKPYGAKLDGV